ncbi:MAG: metal-dependent hydrolase, partial [Candidatus Hermodarchaeota archaeon]
MPQIRSKYRVNRVSLIIGSIFPDLLDKTFLFLQIANGRGYFHTFLFTFVSFLALFLLSKGNKVVSLSFLVGMLFHLILDLPDIPLFYPFVSYNFSYTEPRLFQWIHTLLTNPVVQITEVIGLTLLIIIVKNNKLLNLDNLINYLKTSTI